MATPTVPNGLTGFGGSLSRGQLALSPARHMTPQAITSPGWRNRVLSRGGPLDAFESCRRSSPRPPPSRRADRHHRRARIFAWAPLMRTHSGSASMGVLGGLRGRLRQHYRAWGATDSTRRANPPSRRSRRTRKRARTDLAGDHRPEFRPTRNRKIHGRRGEPPRLAAAGSPSSWMASAARHAPKKRDPPTPLGAPNSAITPSPVYSPRSRRNVGGHHRRAVQEFGHDFSPPLHIHRGRDVHLAHHIGEQHRHLLVLRRVTRNRNGGTTLVGKKTRPDHPATWVSHAPHATPAIIRPAHRLGHREVSFEAKRFRHRAIAIHRSRYGEVVAVSLGEQRAQPEQCDLAYRRTFCSLQVRQAEDRSAASARSASAPRSSSVSPGTRYPKGHTLAVLPGTDHPRLCASPVWHHRGHRLALPRAATVDDR